MQLASCRLPKTGVLAVAAHRSSWAPSSCAGGTQRHRQAGLGGLRVPGCCSRQLSFPGQLALQLRHGRHQLRVALCVAGSRVSGVRRRQHGAEGKPIPAQGAPTHRLRLVQLRSIGRHPRPVLLLQRRLPCSLLRVGKLLGQPVQGKRSSELTKPRRRAPKPRVARAPWVQRTISCRPPAPGASASASSAPPKRRRHTARVQTGVRATIPRQPGDTRRVSSPPGSGTCPPSRSCAAPEQQGAGARLWQGAWQSLRWWAAPAPPQPCAACRRRC